MDILTIDVGGTYIKYGLIDNQLNITNKDKIKTPYHNKEDFLLTLKDLYLKFKNQIEGIAPVSYTHLTLPTTSRV